MCSGQPKISHHDVYVLITQASGDIEVETEGIASEPALGGGMLPKGISRLGRLRDSIVIPFPSFVMPTTAGSPFLTNSY